MKSFNLTLNEWLFSNLWRKNNMLKRTVYCLLPWLLSGFFCFIIYSQNAWYVDGGYGFLNDATNVGVLTYMFIIIYYISGWYSSYSKNKVEQYFNKIKEEDHKEECQKTVLKLDKFSIWLKCLSMFLILFGIWFIYIASLNGENNWYSLLTNWQLVYYSFLVSASWYMSANVLLHSLIVAVKIFKISQYSIKVDLYHHDGSAGFAEIFALFFLNIGLAVYFVLSIILIVLSDFNAVNYNVENAFYKYPILILPIVLLLVFYLIYTIVPLIEVRKVILKNVKTEMQKTEISEDKLKKLKRVYNSMFNVANLIRLLFSNLLLVTQIIINITNLFK